MRRKKERIQGENADNKLNFLKKTGFLTDSQSVSAGKEENKDVKMPDIPGLNIAEGLERMGGAWNLYIDILREFSDIYKNFVQEFKELIQKKAFKEARLRVHSLKGASGNVSATDLTNAAAALDDACERKDPEQIQNLLFSVENALSNFMANTGILIQNKSSVESDTADSENQLNIYELFEQFDKSLDSFDPIGSELYLKKLSDMLNKTSDTFRDDLEILSNHIKHYDFDKAGETLRRIAKNINN